MKLTAKQSAAVKEAKRRVDMGYQSTIIGGLAGTGKTTLVRHLHEALGLAVEEVAYCAFTGKAASVINKRFPQATATTIHSLIYNPKEYHCVACPRGTTKGRENHAPCHSLDCLDCGTAYSPKYSLPPHKRLIIVDEASMVPGFIYDQLNTYGVPIIWVGDHGQLPPIKSGFALMEHPDIVLEEIHRHVADSPILRLAMQVRETGQAPRVGKYGPGVVVKRSGGSFDFEDDEWLGGQLVALAPTNKLRVAVNRAVRKSLGYQGDEPQVDDRVICLRNNKDTAVFNGLTGTILDIEESWLGVPAYHTEIDVDGDFVYRGSAYVDQFLNVETVGYIPREIDLWDYGYCLTVHKSQGSEYERVVLYVDLAKTSDRKRWLYTAITRAKDRLEILYSK